ncbi:hypothetical protein LJR290_003447 [Variovorax sp. LjRoot290]|uniref:hypothetical protein n=1 Tax=Variovorax sp. LjRoot290 TaxID=3342316 RepID=UPI003ED01B85
MPHPLESNIVERARFNAITSTSERSAWRRAVEALTGSLPSWAERKPKGQKPSFDVAAAVAMYRAGGVTLREVGERYGVVPEAIGHHVRKAKAAEAVRA